MAADREALTDEVNDGQLAGGYQEAMGIPDDEGRQDDRPEMPEEAEEDEEEEGLLSRLERLIRSSASLGVVVAAGLGVWQYYEANQEVKRERALEIVKDWNNSGYIDRFSKLQEFVETRVSTTRMPPAEIGEAAMRVALGNLGYGWSQELLAQDQDSSARAVLRDIDRLTLFFAQMEICVQAKLCDAEVLHAYFSTEVSSFWAYFQGYARLRREANYSRYGDPVDRLLERFATMERE